MKGQDTATVTAAQLRTWAAIQEATAIGLGTTHREVQERIGAAYVSAASQSIHRLHRKGLVDWIPNGARSIRASARPTYLQAVRTHTIPLWIESVADADLWLADLEKAAEPRQEALAGR